MSGPADSALADLCSIPRGSWWRRQSAAGDAGSKSARLTWVCAAILGFLALGALGSGVLGDRLGMAKVEEAIAHVNPADKQVIWHAGRSEAMVSLLFGLIVALLPAAGSVFLAGLALSRRSNGPGRSALFVGLALALTLLLVGALVLSSLSETRRVHAAAAMSAWEQAPPDGGRGRPILPT